MRRTAHSSRPPEKREEDNRKRRTAHSSRPPEKREEDNRERRTAHSARPPEKREEDNHKRQTARGTRSSRAKEEEKKKRRDAWAGRDPKEKEKYNESRRVHREERTPEQVETENANAKESMRGLRRARESLELDQSAWFETTKVWEVPGRDYKFKHFQDYPELSVQLFYANNGSWWERELRMLFAYLHLHDKLVCEKSAENGASGVAAEKLCCLSILNRERLEDQVSLCRVVHEHINGSDWRSITDFQVINRINGLEMAVLEWLATKGLDCGDDCKLLREKRKPAPILDSWARSLIGMPLKVPGYWWKNCPNKRKKYDCVVEDVDYKCKKVAEDEEDDVSEKDEGDNGDKRYFMIYCEEDDESYPMEYTHVKEYAEQKGCKRFDLPLEAYQTATDEAFEKLCIDSLGDLEASNHANLSNSKIHYQSIMEEAKRILNSQRVTPEKQRELGGAFLKAQGRGVSWGEATQSEDLMSVDAPLLTCASCGFRVENNGGDRDLKSLCWAELDGDERSKHLERMGKPPLRLPINDKGGEDDFKKFEPWRAYSRWPAKKPDKLTKDATL